MTIIPINNSHKDEYIEMASTFYSSEAVLANIPREHFEATFSELMKGTPFAKCYIFQHNNSIVGYGLTARTFSQEAGGLAIFIEELYVKPEYRSMGFGKQFFEHLFKDEPMAKRFRLEIEEENKSAIRLYKKLGFEFLDYLQMYIQR